MACIWHVSHKLDIPAMKKAAEYIVGEHDFKSFCSVKTQVESTVRTVYSLEVANKTYKEKYDTVILKITGNGFLYNMVRIIAGTLVQIRHIKKNMTL